MVRTESAASCSWAPPNLTGRNTGQASFVESRGVCGTEHPNYQLLERKEAYFYRRIQREEGAKEITAKMPGILPMKVIKVGTSSQSRIAQACDRCRSKKIRCDGIRPCCSQCANVGFECKTSDKLSRRAFPRGYTESLEERVRQLESEVRELKDLLDEKDEKIDMLSKMHSNNHHRPSIDSTSGSRPGVDAKRDATPPAKEDTFRVQASPLLLGVENSDSYFMGASSGRAFIGLCTYHVGTELVVAF